MNPHYEALDGLRGTAALSVFMFHLLELIVPDAAHNPLRHAYLAVDFFFALSGFVLSYSYDYRFSRAAVPEARLTLKEFFIRRLIRLHPMVAVGVTTGLAVYLLDPFAASEQQVGIKLSYSLLFVNYGLGLLMLPAPSLPNCFGMTHSLNGPSWSLTQEYLGSILYGLTSRRFGTRGIAIICVACASGLVVSGLYFKSLSIGWAWDNFWPAPIRLGASFFAGILIHRLNLKLSVPFSYAVLSIVLLATFAAPEMSAVPGLADILCVLIVFPLVVMAGAGASNLTGLPICAPICPLELEPKAF